MYMVWSISGAFDDILEKHCLKDIELSKKYAEASGTDEGYIEVLPAYDYMVEYYIDHNKLKKWNFFSCIRRTYHLGGKGERTKFQTDKSQ